MKKAFLIFCFLSAAAYIFLSAIHIVAFHNINRAYKKLQLESSKQIKFDGILDIAKEVSKEEYIEGERTCTDFAKEAYLKYKEKGIYSHIVLGRTGSTSGHAWIATYIDPTTGEFLDRDDYSIVDVCIVKDDKFNCLNGDLRKGGDYKINQLDIGRQFVQRFYGIKLKL